jgi:surface protein
LEGDKVLSDSQIYTTADFVVGEHTITLNVTNDKNETGTDVIITVKEKPDTAKPVITLLGDKTVTLLVGDEYADAGATADDNKDGDLTKKINTVNPVDTTNVGTYTVTYNVSDAAGNIADEVIRVVEVKEKPDTTKPVITLTGEETIAIIVGNEYVDAGATADDNRDGDLTKSIKTLNEVNSNIIGTYVVTYNVADAAGNTADEVVRTVNVIEQPDETAPVITLLGDKTVTLLVGDEYTDAGATADDNRDGDLTQKINTIDPVDTTIAGTYVITYNVSDAAGNLADEVSRTVTVLEPDTTPPTITLNGEETVAITVGDNYNDAGAIATDDRDGDITKDIKSVSDVDSKKIGTYTVTYNVSDKAGNVAQEVIRTVNVERAKHFVISVTTDNEGTSSDNEFTIPTVPYNEIYDYSVDCDSDGVNEAEGVTGDYTCSYAKPGTYKVSILGNLEDNTAGFPRIYFNDSKISQKEIVGDEEKLVGINQWGITEWTSMAFAFSGCSNLNETGGAATDLPNLSKVKTFRLMFMHAAKFNQDIGRWDTSNVDDMAGMFAYATDFNQNIGNWDTSNVTKMAGMFAGTRAFDLDMSKWDTSKVRDMRYMLYGSVFDHDISTWDVSSVKYYDGFSTFAKITKEHEPIFNDEKSSTTKESSEFKFLLNFD